MLDAEDRALLHLPPDGLVDPRITVPKHDRPVAEQIVEVLMAVDVPEPCPLASGGERGAAQLHDIHRPFVGLSAAHDGIGTSAPRVAGSRRLRFSIKSESSILASSTTCIRALH